MRCDDPEDLAKKLKRREEQRRGRWADERGSSNAAESMLTAAQAAQPPQDVYAAPTLEAEAVRPRATRDAMAPPTLEAPAVRRRPEGDSPARADLVDQVELLSQVVAQLQRGGGAPDGPVPAWLVAAVGDPSSYDSPDSRRANVCARVSDADYARLKAIKEARGFRTLAGVWAYALRLCFAVDERLSPARKP